MTGLESVREYAAAVRQGLSGPLEERLNLLVAAGVPLPDPADLVAAMVSAVPDAPPHPAAVELGPLLSSSGAMRMLGLDSEKALGIRRDRWEVLAMRTTDGVWVYPALQFDPRRGGLRPGFAGVLNALRGTDRWAAGLWLVAGHPDLGGRSPSEGLADGVEPALVTRLARHYRQATSAT